MDIFILVEPFDLIKFCLNFLDAHVFQDIIFQIRHKSESLANRIYLSSEGSDLFILCGRRDSNPHAFRHQILSLARLPITPRPHFQFSVKISSGRMPISNIALPR